MNIEQSSCQAWTRERRAESKPARCFKALAAEQGRPQEAQSQSFGVIWRSGALAYSCSQEQNSTPSALKTDPDSTAAAFLYPSRAQNMHPAFETETSALNGSVAGSVETSASRLCKNCKHRVSIVGGFVVFSLLRSHQPEPVRLRTSAGSCAPSGSA